jgi:hypothetical protein
MLSSQRNSLATVPEAMDFGATFDTWIDGVQWLNPESINWVSPPSHVNFYDF